MPESLFEPPLKTSKICTHAPILGLRAVRALGTILYLYSNCPDVLVLELAYKIRFDFEHEKAID